MSKQIKSLLILVIIAGTIIGLFLIGRFFGSGENVESEKPLVICQPQNVPPEQQKCNWTAHIHATVKIFTQRKEIPVSFEEGELEGQHTHSEPNKLHWHGLIPVDSTTKEVTDWSTLEVQKVVTDFNLSQEGTPKFIINGKEVEPSYIWKDGDTIEIHYE